MIRVVIFLFLTMSRPASHLMDTSGTLTTILHTAKFVGLATCYFPHYQGGKCGRCVGLTTTPPSCANCHEIWEPQPAGTLRACLGIVSHFFTIIISNQLLENGPLSEKFTSPNILKIEVARRWHVRTSTIMLST